MKCAAALICFALACGAAPQTVYEQAELSVVHTNRIIKLTIANFGLIPYGTSMQGRLIYPSPEFDTAEPKHNCGRMACNYACDPLTQAIPPYHFADGHVNFVLLDRVPDEQRINLGNCSHLDKAANAALAGADAVIIVDTDDEPNVAVARGTAEYFAKQNSLKVPVGMIGASDGAFLRNALRISGPYPVQMQLNFLSLIAESVEVVVEIWHDTADDCGPNCDTVHSVLSYMADPATTLQIHDKRVRFEPHFMLSSYCGTNCDSQCINNKYCYLTPTKFVPGVDVAAENIRQACMFETLRDNGRAANWWAYSVQFQNSCKSSEGNFNAQCSIQVFSKIWPDLLWAWQQCWQGVGGTGKIPIAEKELALAAGNEQRARIILNPTVRINDQQYRGNLDKAAIFKAICSAFPSGTEPEACSQFGIGACRPGGPGAQTCSSPASIDLHRTRCVETFMGFECQCSPGYSQEGSAGCVDINECAQGNVCAAKGQRMVCINTPGSFKCEKQLDRCTSEFNYGDCWQAKTRNGLVHSCVDNLATYRWAAAEGLPLPPISRCECAAIPGCWHDQGDGKCVQLCPASECLADKGVCRSKPGLSMLWIVLIVIFACGAGLAGTLMLHRYHRASVDDRMRRLLAEYVPLESSSDRAYSVGGSTDWGFSFKRDHKYQSVFIRAGEPGSMRDGDQYAGP